MKTAIYVEDGTVQLVITPESDFEKNALSTMSLIIRCDQETKPA